MNIRSFSYPFLAFFFYGLCASTLQAQSSLGLKMTLGGSSFMRKLPVLNNENSTRPGPFGSIGLFGQTKIGGKWYLDASLMLAQSSSRAHHLLYGNDQTGNRIVIGNLFVHVNYTSIVLPIMLERKFDRHSFALGIQGAVQMRGSMRTNGFMVYGGHSYPHIDRADAKFIPFDFGPKAAYGYAISEQISLEGSFYFGLPDIREGEGNLGPKWHAMQLTAGLRWHFANWPAVH